MKRPSASETRGARPRSALLLLTVFFTGLLSLACQAIWLRKLTVLFGSTAAVSISSGAVFFLGLALGALAMGRPADRRPAPWRRLGLLLLGLGAYCLLSMPVFDLARRIFPRGLGSLLVVSIVTILPAFLLGAVFPLAVRIHGRDPERLGRSLSLLYGTAFLGAALGLWLAGFVLVPDLGLSASTWLLGLVAVGLGLVILSVRGRENREAAAPIEIAPAEEGGRPLAAVLAAFFLSGAAALILKTGGGRFFALLDGPALHATSAVLAGALLGLGAGSLLMALRIDRIREPFGFAAWLYAVVAIGATMIFNSERLFTSAYFALFRWTGSVYAFQLGISLVVLFIASTATFALGAGFPLVARLATRTAAERGAAAGRALFAGALGAVLGVLAAELVLLPAWGFSGLILTALAVCAVASGISLSLVPRPDRWRSGIVCALLLAWAVWRSPLLTSFRPPVQALYYHGLRDGSLEAYRQESAGLQTVEQTQGLYGQVSVVRSGEDLFLKGNGRTEASTMARDSITQLLLGHLPMLFHPSPRRVLAIGLGGGITLRALVHHPEAQSITVAEVDPVVVEAARRWFTPYNDRALDDPRVRMVTADGRDYVDATKERFDVITSAPASLWMPGASSLFTEEFYRSASAHLSTGGILCQWLPLSEMEKEDFRTLLNTIHRVFPNVTFWKVGADVILLASREPFQIEQEPTVARLRNAALGQDFTAIGITMRGVLQIMNTPVVRPDQVPAFLGQVEAVNVDDKPVLELATARNLYKLAKQGK